MSHFNVSTSRLHYCTQAATVSSARKGSKKQSGKANTCSFPYSCVTNSPDGKGASLAQTQIAQWNLQGVAHQLVTGYCNPPIAKASATRMLATASVIEIFPLTGGGMSPAVYMNATETTTGRTTTSTPMLFPPANHEAAITQTHTVTYVHVLCSF